MQRRLRLPGGKCFSSVHRDGQTWTNQLLVLKALPSGLEQSRLAFAAGRRLGSAVVRNRVKRRLREGARLIHVKAGWDALFIARKEAVTADFRRLKQASDDLLTRARLLEGPLPEGNRK